MAEVFNNKPAEFVDMNTMFAVLNDKVGLTSEQWRILVENTNYLKNHLGLADVDVGSVETIFTEPGTMADVIVSHREEVVGEKVFDFFDYVIKIPTPKIEASLTSQLVETPQETGMELEQTAIYGQGNLANVIIGYRFSFTSKMLNQELLGNAVPQFSPNGENTIINNNDGVKVRCSGQPNSSYVDFTNTKFSVIQRTTLMGSERIEFVVDNNGVKINEKLVATQEYVDNLVGTINTILTELNSGGGV